MTKPEIKFLQKTFALMNSMILSGENHSASSKDSYETAMKLLSEKEESINKTHDLMYPPGYSFHAEHIPTGETWLILGIDIDNDRVCAAGYPPTIAKLSDCRNVTAIEKLTEDELRYRKRKFGSNWR